MNDELLLDSSPASSRPRCPTFTGNTLDPDVLQEEVLVTEESQISGLSDARLNSQYLASPHFCGPEEWGNASGKSSLFFCDDPSIQRLDRLQMTLEDISSSRQRTALTPLVLST